MQKTHFFVMVKSNDLGVGKVIGYSASGSQAIVEYFDSPTTVDRRQVVCATDELQRIFFLEDQTRVYFYDPVDSTWKMGRMEGHIDEICYIALPNKEQARIPQTEVYVRWNVPLSNPAEHLKSGLTETPYFHQRRLKLVSHLIQQRAAVQGMTALISAPVFLERHQLEVVTRVLSDPVQRYLLADEVGLGKTIEAGMIARQHILDNPDDHSVIVLVPAALVNQWRYELCFRCNIGGEFLHQVEVQSYEEFLLNSDVVPDLLIVDEAHQITRPEYRAFYSKLCEVSHPSKCAKLLLLSATPVRGNENGFLSLLHLLDPTIYHLDRIEAFRLRVAKRQDLANLFTTLTHDQDDYFLEQAIVEASSLFAEDVKLQDLTKELLALIRTQDPSDSKAKLIRPRLIGALRTYLSDTYRLDRRLLRNRRSSSIDGLLPGRAGLRKVRFEGGGKQIAERFVELWRERAAKMCWDLGDPDSLQWEKATDLFCTFLEASWNSPLQFLELVRQRKLAVSDSGLKSKASKGIRGPLTVPCFEGELALLDEVLRQEEEVEEEFDCLVDAICESTLREKEAFERVVVMCSDSKAADTIYRRLNLRTLVPILRCVPDRDLSTNWVTPGILICDNKSEEGLNLQGGKVILIHADLPLSPNRIEQRVGRLDRIGVGHAVPSVVLTPSGDQYREGWIQVLEHGWQIFHRSIASLQYLVQDEMHSLRRQLFAGGSGAFSQALENIGGNDGLIQQELRAIRNQDELDALGNSDSGIGDLIDNIEAYEHKAEEFSQSMNDWVLEVLRFLRVGEEDRSDRVWRYHYRSTGRGIQTLISRSAFARWFESAVDPEAEHSAFGPPLSWPMASQRETARRRNVGVARLGHSWIDSINAHLRWDDRGTCAAIWRAHSTWKASPQPYYHFVAIVEANTDILNAWCERNDWTNHRTVGRIADSIFPPVVVSLWLGVDLLSPSLEAASLLERKYDKGMGDINISGIRWRGALNNLQISAQEWSDTCSRISDAAQKLVLEEQNLVHLIESKMALHDESFHAITQQLTNRLEVATEGSTEATQIKRDLDRSAQLHGAIRESIKSARIRFDSVLVTILSSEKFE